MARWSRERVTLVVEAEAIRMMAVAGGRVSRWGSAPLPRGVLDAEGRVRDEPLLAQTLERLWQSQALPEPLPRQEVLLAIPGHRVATTIVPLAEEDGADRAQMAEVARSALAQPDAYVAWQVVGRAPRTGLFALAAPETLVDGYVRALERAGLGLAAVDVKPLALIRGVGQRHAVIVDAERAQGTIIVVDDALPRRVRFQTLALPLLLSPEDKVLRLAEVLSQTLRDYNQDDGEQVLHPAVPIFLTGSLVAQSLLHDVVRTLLRHPVGEITTPFPLPPEMPTGQFLANVGLAQKQL